MAEDLLPPTPDPEPVRPSRPSRLVCEFCGCTLATNGDIVKRGDAAKAYMEQETKIADAQKQIVDLQAKVRELAPTPGVARKLLAWD